MASNGDSTMDDVSSSEDRSEGVSSISRKASAERVNEVRSVPLERGIKREREEQGKRFSEPKRTESTIENAITVYTKGNVSHKVTGGSDDTLLKALYENEFLGKKKGPKLIPKDLKDSKCKGIPNLGLPIRQVNGETFDIDYNYPKLFYRQQYPEKYFESGFLIHVEINKVSLILKTDQDKNRTLTVQVVPGESLFKALHLDGRFRMDRYKQFAIEEEIEDGQFRQLNHRQLLSPIRTKFRNFKIVQQVRKSGSEMYDDEIKQILEIKQNCVDEKSEEAKRQVTTDETNAVNADDNKPQIVRLKRCIDELLNLSNKKFTTRKSGVEKRRIIGEKLTRTGFSRNSQIQLSAAVVNKMNNYQRAVCRIMTKDESGLSAKGVGWHIGRGYIITNHHVVYSKDPLTKQIYCNPRTIRISFKCIVDAECRCIPACICKEYSIKETIYSSQGNIVDLDEDGSVKIGESLDYAIIKLETNVGVSQIPFVSPEDFNERPLPVTIIHIIGFTDRSLKKIVDCFCLTLGGGCEDKTKGISTFFSTSAAQRYRCDMLRGSSGSLVVDNEGKPVLLHHGGFTHKDYGSFEEGISLGEIKRYVSNELRGKMEESSELKGELGELYELFEGQKFNQPMDCSS